MKKHRRIRGWLLVAPGWLALIAIGCPCQPPDGPALKDPCGVRQAQGFFVAAADEALIAALRTKQVYWTEEMPPPTEEARATACCTFFTAQLEGKFCMPQVNRFCDTRCPDEAAKRDCKDAHRDAARVRCAEEALGLLHRELSVCKEMGLVGVNPTWPWDGGPHAVCPRAQ